MTEGGSEFEQLVACVAAAVSADWTATGAPLGHIEIRPVSMSDTGAGEPYRLLTVEVSAEDHGLRVRLGRAAGHDPMGALISAIVDELQVLVAEAAPTWGTAWPRCPLHPQERSPLSVAATTPTWICTRTRKPVCAVGQLTGP